MTREQPILLCDGCRVNPPHEHRCHEEWPQVNGEPQPGKKCECEICHPTPEELAAFRKKLEKKPSFWCSACHNMDPKCGACYGQGYETEQVEKNESLQRGLEQARRGEVGPGPDLEEAQRIVDQVEKDERIDIAYLIKAIKCAPLLPAPGDLEVVKIARSHLRLLLKHKDD